MARIEIALEDRLQDDGRSPKLHANIRIPPAPNDTTLAPMSLHAAADIQRLIQAGAVAAQLVTARTEQHSLFIACLLDFLCECAEKPPERWREVFDDLGAFAENARLEFSGDPNVN